MKKGGRCSLDPIREVREMRSAETVLGIIHERGKQGLPLIAESKDNNNLKKS
jgi:hypothetical protein